VVLPDWTFGSAHLYDDQSQDGLLLYGLVTNNTGSSQELLAITGIFHDAQGQVIDDANISYSYWPGYVIPPGGSMPFELMVDNIDSSADFDLSAEAKSSSEIPRQDFEWSDLDRWIEDDSYYCVAGTLRNPGGELSDYLAIALILYDDQDGVVSFRAYEEFGPEWIAGDQPLEFELCADLLSPTIRHEMRAWGQ
jgi:hypothetical protein